MDCCARPTNMPIGLNVHSAIIVVYMDHKWHASERAKMLAKKGCCCSQKKVQRPGLCMLVDIIDPYTL